jgi:hypothetical protein
MFCLLFKVKDFYFIPVQEGISLTGIPVQAGMTCTEKIY